MRFVIVPGIAGSMSGVFAAVIKNRAAYGSSSGRWQPCDRTYLITGCKSPRAASASGTYAGRMRAHRFGRAGPVSPHRLPIVRRRPATSAPIGTSTSASSAPPSASRSSAPSADYLMPLALVVHASRPTADVPVADARRLVASGATRWSAIGQSGGEMRVLSTGDRRASAVLREVRTSSEVLGVVPADTVDARVRVLTVGGRHPLRDPERYPLRIRSVRPVPEVTTLTASATSCSAAASATVTVLTPERR